MNWISFWDIFHDIRKQNGGEYEPDSLTALQSSINRHLQKKGGHVDIITDREFETLRSVLAAKRKHLRSMGQGKPGHR